MQAAPNYKIHDDLRRGSKRHFDFGLALLGFFLVAMFLSSVIGLHTADLSGKQVFVAQWLWA